MISLNDIELEKEVKVINIEQDSKIIKKRLLEMGLTKGTRVKIIKVGPSGNLKTIKLRGYNLTLSSSELSKIKVEKIY